MNLAGHFRNMPSPPILSVEDAPFSGTINSTENEIFVSSITSDIGTVGGPSPRVQGGVFSNNVPTKGGGDPDGDGNYVLIDKA